MIRDLVMDPHLPYSHAAARLLLAAPPSSPWADAAERLLLASMAAVDRDRQPRSFELPDGQVTCAKRPGAEARVVEAWLEFERAAGVWVHPERRP